MSKIKVIGDIPFDPEPYRIETTIEGYAKTDKVVIDLDETRLLLAIEDLLGSNVSYDYRYLNNEYVFMQH